MEFDYIEITFLFFAFFYSQKVPYTVLFGASETHYIFFNVQGIKWKFLYDPCLSTKKSYKAYMT